MVKDAKQKPKFQNIAKQYKPWFTIL